MKLVAKNGRLLENHETTLNKKQLSKFNEALHWYEKATDKITKRYEKGAADKKEKQYARAVALAAGLSVDIDNSFRDVISGESTVGEFKEKIRAWFKKVKEGMDDADIEE